MTSLRVAAGGKSQWQVPFSVCSKSSPEKAIYRGVLKERETTIRIENVPEADWIKVCVISAISKSSTKFSVLKFNAFFQLNMGSIGFYRTQYESDVLDALLPAIRDRSLPARDRLGLQNDIYALASLHKP